MTYLIAGLAIFFGTHLFSAVRPRTPGKDLRERLGYGPFMGLYSILAGAGFALIIWGYSQTERVAMDILYVPPAWGRHAAMGLMLLALILLVSSYMPTGYIKRAARHPMLLGVALWGAAHLLVNGELNAVILFGSFLAYAIVDRVAVAMRGDGGPPVRQGVLGDVLSVVIGTGAYFALVYVLHPILFGVRVVY